MKAVSASLIIAGLCLPAAVRAEPVEFPGLTLAVQPTEMFSVEPGFYLALKGTSQVTSPLKDHARCNVACLVGDVVYVDEATLRKQGKAPGAPVDLSFGLFVGRPLPAQPSRCEIRALVSSERVGSWCWENGAVRKGKCGFPAPDPSAPLIAVRDVVMKTPRYVIGGPKQNKYYVGARFTETWLRKPKPAEMLQLKGTCRVDGATVTETRLMSESRLYQQTEPGESQRMEAMVFFEKMFDAPPTDCEVVISSGQTVLDKRCLQGTTWSACLAPAAAPEATAPAASAAPAAAPATETATAAPATTAKPVVAPVGKQAPKNVLRRVGPQKK